MSSPPAPIHFWVYGSRATFQRSLEQLQRGSRKMKDVSVGPDRLILPTEPPECPALFQLASQCLGVTVFGSLRVAPGTLLRRSPPPHRFLKTFGCPTGYLMNVNPRLRPHTDCDRQKKCE